MKVSAKDIRALEAVMRKLQASGPYVTITESQLASMKRAYAVVSKDGVPPEMEAVAKRLGLI